MKEVFQLEKAPKFLISETTGDLTMIKEADLTKDDKYIINVLDVRNMPRIDTGTYLFLAGNISSKPINFLLQLFLNVTK